MKTLKQFITHLFASLLLLCLAGQALAQANTDAASKPIKFVIQVSDAEPAKWNLALNNAKNVQQELGADKVAIEVVAYGPGIGMLKLDATVNSRVSEAVKDGVKVYACENTMKNQKLAKADMHPASGFVNSGVVHLVQRQSQGWAYIRP